MLLTSIHTMCLVELGRGRDRGCTCRRYVCFFWIPEEGRLQYPEAEIALQYKSSFIRFIRFGTHDGWPHGMSILHVLDVSIQCNS